MLFWNNDYSRGLVGHMRPSHPWCGQLAPSAAGCVIFCEMDWRSRSGTYHRKYIGLPRRIDRNEYYFALLYIVCQVTISYSALQFQRNSPVFWCFEIPRMPGHKVACCACVRIPMYSRLWTLGTAVIHREYVNTIDRNIDYRSKCSSMIYDKTNVSQ